MSYGVGTYAANRGDSGAGSASIGGYAATKRQELEALRGQLEQERSSFISHWRAIGEYIQPRRPRFTITDVNQGDRRNQKILDSTGTLAARTLASGMMAGVTSPARPWFRLTVPDPELAESGAVKSWLHIVTARMATVFLRSNLYNALPTVYGDMGSFATAAVGIEEDFENVIRSYPFPIGSYYISTNERGVVDTFMREMRFTIRQLVSKFGYTSGSKEIDWRKFSTVVKAQWDKKNFEHWVDVCHVIRPNPEYDPASRLNKHKRYEACYYEIGVTNAQAGNYMSKEREDLFLDEKGYSIFPVLCPRWETTGEDAYGTNCPGMVALGDIKQLQSGEKTALKAIQKMADPPMVAPTALRTSRTSILPGDITYSDETATSKGFRPAHEVDPRIQELEGKQEQVRVRVRRAFFEDLFLMLHADTRQQPPTAREIEERHEEKLLALGPVLEQLNQDLLDPLIDITFEYMDRQGLIPEPPEEIAGMPLNVEYVSIMAQAQKLIGLAGLERFAGFVGNLAANTQDPSVLDKVDIEQMIDVYGDTVGVDPGIIRADEVVAQMKQDRAKAAQAQQQATVIREGAGAARDLASADMSGDNALTRLIKRANAGNPVPVS
jgi:hypothetical protein